MIGLSPSTYYYRPKRSRKSHEREDASLRDAVEAAQQDFPRAGYRTAQVYLRRQGRWVGERRVYPNLLPGRCLTGINQAWVADLTYIRIVNSFVYLAVILDLFSRKVIGWAISIHIDAEIALAALRQAIAARKPAPGCVHHSDRGVPYLCNDYVALLTEHQFLISNSAKGNPYHNAFAESFMKTLKQEEVYLANYETYLDVLENLPTFIEEVYNEKRVHSGIDYLTSSELEEWIKIDPTLTSRFVLQL